LASVITHQVAANNKGHAIEELTMAIPPTITRAAVAQYEALRRMGTINMFHYEGIQREALFYRMAALRALSQSDYYFIFRNGEALLAHYALTEITDPDQLRLIE
jgi:hypothetical protein